MSSSVVLASGLLCRYYPGEKVNVIDYLEVTIDDSSESPDTTPLDWHGIDAINTDYIRQYIVIIFRFITASHRLSLSFSFLPAPNM